MKKLFLSLLVLPFAVQAQRVSVDIEGLGSDSLKVSYSAVDRNFGGELSVWAQDGKATIDVPSKHPVWVGIIPKSLIVRRPDNGEFWPRTCKISLLLYPGESVDVRGKVENSVLKYEAAGTEYNLEMSGLRNVKLPLYIMSDSVNLLIEHDPANSLHRKRKNEISDLLALENFKEINRDPNSAIAGELAADLPSDSMEVYYNKLGPKAKAGVFEKLLKEELAYARAELRMMRKERAKTPQITLKTELSLEDIKGKEYIVVDFWGTWCGPCLAGIPLMKEYYEKCNDKVEFVSVDCGDKEEGLREFLAEYDLPWIHVIENPYDKLSAEWGVEVYPTKFILDAEHKIVAKFEGEGYDFYEKLDELMSK